MTKEEKEQIAQSLKNECQFLLSVANLFMVNEDAKAELPKEALEQNEIIHNGLMKIRGRIADEYEAIIMGEVDE